MPFLYMFMREWKKLKKTDIIKKNYEFKYFFKKGNYFSGHLIEVFIFNSKYYRNKLGVVVSKKVGGSVTRNRLKRFIREAYSSIEDSICVNCNLLIVWKKNVNPDNASFWGVKADLENILKRSGNMWFIWRVFLEYYLNFIRKEFLQFLV